MVGEKRHLYSVYYRKWCLPDYWKIQALKYDKDTTNQEVGLIFLVYPNTWVAPCPLWKDWTRCTSGSLQPSTTDQSPKDSLPTSFSYCVSLHRTTAEESSQSLLYNRIFSLKCVFFLIKTIVKKKTVSVIHIFQLCHVCNNCNGNLIHPLIKTIWEITSPNFFTRENIFVSMWKTWWQSQQWSWYHVSWKLKDVPKACRGEMATKLNTYALCKMYSSVFSPGKKQFVVQMGFLIPSWWYLHASLPSLPPFLPPCLGTANLLGFKSFSARRNSERRKTAGKHIHDSWKGMRLKYYCEAQHHFPKTSHSLK